MKRYLTVGLTFAAALWTFQGAHAADVLGLTQSGTDADAVYYEARCSDGQSGMVISISRSSTSTACGESAGSCAAVAPSSVASAGADDEVCAQALGGERVCRSDWSLMGAAAVACR